jgi:CheY-like chemotaxis protein
MPLAPEAVGFVGDLSDPWVVSIAGELARYAEVVQVHAPGELPEWPFDDGFRPSILVIHRNRVSAADGRRLSDYRGQADSSKATEIVLCVSPFVRYETLERWASLADSVISEATAADTLPRYVVRRLLGLDRSTPNAAPDGFRVEVLGNNHDLGRAVVEVCEAAGYRARQVADWGSAPKPGQRVMSGGTPVLTIADVAVLEPGWPEWLERIAKTRGPVVALIGFADRAIVTEARARGAVACLELPFHIDDLVAVIDRSARLLPGKRPSSPARAEPAHQLPPAPRHANRSHPATSDTVGVVRPREKA